MHLAKDDPITISRKFQGSLSGIWFLDGAVNFESGFDVNGIRAAAIRITDAVGLAIATSYWGLGLVVGLITVVVLFVADRFPEEVREAKQEAKSEARTMRDTRGSGHPSQRTGVFGVFDRLTCPTAQSTAACRAIVRLEVPQELSFSQDIEHDTGAGSCTFS